MSWFNDPPDFEKEMAEQSRTCVFTVKSCAAGFKKSELSFSQNSPAVEEG